MSYYGMSDEESLNLWAERFFEGYCPYTGEKCQVWECHKCEVEKTEREFAKGE